MAVGGAAGGGGELQKVLDVIEVFNNAYITKSMHARCKTKPISVGIWQYMKDTVHIQIRRGQYGPALSSEILETVLESGQFSAYEFYTILPAMTDVSPLKLQHFKDVGLDALLVAVSLLYCTHVGVNAEQHMVSDDVALAIYRIFGAGIRAEDVEMNVIVGGRLAQDTETPTRGPQACYTEQLRIAQDEYNTSMSRDSGIERQMPNAPFAAFIARFKPNDVSCRIHPTERNRERIAAFVATFTEDRVENLNIAEFVECDRNLGFEQVHARTGVLTHTNTSGHNAVVAHIQDFNSKFKSKTQEAYEALNRLNRRQCGRPYKQDGYLFDVKLMSGYTSVCPSVVLQYDLYNFVSISVKRGAYIVHTVMLGLGSNHTDACTCYVNSKPLLKGISYPLTCEDRDSHTECFEHCGFETIGMAYALLYTARMGLSCLVRGADKRMALVLYQLFGVQVDESDATVTDGYLERLRAEEAVHAKASAAASAKASRERMQPDAFFQWYEHTYGVAATTRTVMDSDAFLAWYKHNYTKRVDYVIQPTPANAERITQFLSAWAQYNVTGASDDVFMRRFMRGPRIDSLVDGAMTPKNALAHNQLLIDIDGFNESFLNCTKLGGSWLNRLVRDNYERPYESGGHLHHPMYMSRMHHMCMNVAIQYHSHRSVEIMVRRGIHVVSKVKLVKMRESEYRGFVPRCVCYLETLDMATYMSHPLAVNEGASDYFQKSGFGTLVLSFALLYSIRMGMTQKIQCQNPVTALIMYRIFGTVFEGDEIHTEDTYTESLRAAEAAYILAMPAAQKANVSANELCMNSVELMRFLREDYGDQAVYFVHAAPANETRVAAFIEKWKTKNMTGLEESEFVERYMKGPKIEDAVPDFEFPGLSSGVLNTLRAVEGINGVFALRVGAASADQEAGEAVDVNIQFTGTCDASVRIGCNKQTVAVCDVALTSKGPSRVSTLKFHASQSPARKNKVVDLKLKDSPDRGFMPLLVAFSLMHALNMGTKACLCCRFDIVAKTMFDIFGLDGNAGEVNILPIVYREWPADVPPGPARLRGYFDVFRSTWIRHPATLRYEVRPTPRNKALVVAFVDVWEQRHIHNQSDVNFAHAYLPFKREAGRALFLSELKDVNYNFACCLDDAYRWIHLPSPTPDASSSTAAGGVPTTSGGASASRVDRSRYPDTEPWCVQVVLSRNDNDVVGIEVRRNMQTVVAVELRAHDPTNHVYDTKMNVQRLTDSAHPLHVDEKYADYFQHCGFDTLAFVCALLYSARTGATQTIRTLQTHHQRHGDFFAQTMYDIFGARFNAADVDFVCSKVSSSGNGVAPQIAFGSGQMGRTKFLTHLHENYKDGVTFDVKPTVANMLRISEFLDDYVQVNIIDLKNSEFVERYMKTPPMPAEPAPMPAEPAPMPAEPAPMPAEPAPMPAEPAPMPAEPAPMPAEPAPAPVAAAPAPVTAAPAPAGAESAAGEIAAEESTPRNGKRKADTPTPDTGGVGHAATNRVTRSQGGAPLP